MNAAWTGWEPLAVRQSFDGHDLVAVVRQGQRHAGVNAPAVDLDRARAAFAAVAALFCSGESEALTQCIEQRGARIDREVLFMAVDAMRMRQKP